MAAGSTQLGSPVRKEAAEKALYNKVKRLQSEKTVKRPEEKPN